MSFTPEELKLLALSDQALNHDPRIKRPGVGMGRGGGRPRTRPSTPDVERRRAYNLARYYAKKSNQQGHDR